MAQQLGDEHLSRLLAAYLALGDKLPTEAPVHSTEAALFQPWVELLFKVVESIPVFTQRIRKGCARRPGAKQTSVVSEPHATRLAANRQKPFSIANPFPTLKPTLPAGSPTTATTIGPRSLACPRLSHWSGF